MTAVDQMPVSVTEVAGKSEFVGDATTRFCVDCRHYLKGDCMHSQSPTDYVNGAWTFARWMRRSKNEPDGICGPQGRLYERRPESGEA